jgi:hypothetical protein
MDGLTPEDVAREIRAELEQHPWELSDGPVEGMYIREAMDALDGVADRFVRLFTERNRAFNAVEFKRACGLRE